MNNVYWEYRCRRCKAVFQPCKSQVLDDTLTAEESLLIVMQGDELVMPSGAVLRSTALHHACMMWNEEGVGVADLVGFVSKEE